MDSYRTELSGRRGAWAADPFAPPPVSPGRRRLGVFAATFVVLAGASLAYDYSRPAEYRAGSRLQIIFPGAAAGDAGTGAAFLAEVQMLTSRPLVEQVLADLREAGRPLPADADDPVGEVQRQLDARPVPGTNIVQLTAIGHRPETLAPLLDTLVDAYRRRMSARFQRDAGEESEQAGAQARRLAAQIADKRRALDDFRAQYGIVSADGGENPLLAGAEGRTAALAAANQRLSEAEARVGALRKARAAGRSVVSASDDPVLANLEQRASVLHEELRDMERSYTQDFLALDPKARSLRARIADLDNQIRQVRDSGLQAALRRATDEAAAAKSEVGRLARAADADRRDAQALTGRLRELRAMEADVARLEELQRGALARAAALDSGAHAPTVRLLEPASMPIAAWRPPYTRDAVVAVVGSLFVALLATWVVELFRRAEARPAVVVAPAWIPAGGGGRPAPMADDDTPALPPVVTLPRELGAGEIRSLLAELSGPPRLAAIGLLSGLSVEELARLHRPAIDLETRRLHLPDRSLGLSPVFHEALMAACVRRGPGGEAPAAAALGVGLQPAEIDAALVAAAHDAGLADPGQVTAAALRHSYIAYLVRQGVRFLDLARIVGRLPADAIAPYAALAPSGDKQPWEHIDPVHPALRQLRLGGGQVG